MNHKKIRPLLKEGSDREDWDETDIAGYHMTNARKGRVLPIGYCVRHEPHETKQEAAECFEEYQLESVYDESWWGYHKYEWSECAVCGELGHWEYQSRPWSFLPRVWACEQHKGKSVVEENLEITESVESMGSW